MGRIFYLGGHQYEFSWWREQSLAADRVRFEDVSAAGDFLRSLLSDSFEIAKLTGLAIESRGSALPHGDSPESLLNSLAWDLFHGRLSVTRSERVYPISLGTEREEQVREEPGPAPPVSRRTEKNDWIEIELVDMQDKPIRNQRWEITWPDGSTVSEGRTDHRGVGRIDWIDPSGMCRITFPDLDRSSWERVS